MTRIRTKQPASSKPRTVTLSSVPMDWTTIAEADDYSVPDTQQRFDERDPADPTRRIQPGQSLIMTPVLIYNSDTTTRWIEMRILREDGTSASQVKRAVPPGDTYLHPAAGQVLTKYDPDAANGDRLQVRAETSGVLTATMTAGVGSAEEHQP